MVLKNQRNQPLKVRCSLFVMSKISVRVHQILSLSVAMSRTAPRSTSVSETFLIPYHTADHLAPEWFILYTGPFACVDLTVAIKFAQELKQSHSLRIAVLPSLIRFVFRLAEKRREMGQKEEECWGRVWWRRTLEWRRRGRRSLDAESKFAFSSK